MRSHVSSSGWFGDLGQRISRALRAHVARQLEAGYRVSDRWKISAAVYNLFDSKDNDISYYYASQLANEPAPVDDIHFHPVEPRTLRLTLRTTF